MFKMNFGGNKALPSLGLTFLETVTNVLKFAEKLTKKL